MYEQEIKLTAEYSNTLDQVLKSKLVRRLDIADGGNRNAVPYRGIYYDTEQHQLESSRCTLRVRSEGDKWRAAVKYGGGIRNGLSQRHELQTDLADWPKHVKQFNVAQLPDGELKQKLVEIIPETATVFARVYVDMKRIIRNLNFEGTEIELAVDSGTITSAGKKVTLHEVELELKLGDLENMIKLGEMFTQLFPLVQSIMSKHRIGLQLATMKQSA